MGKPRDDFNRFCEHLRMHDGTTTSANGLAKQDGSNSGSSSIAVLDTATNVKSFVHKLTQTRPKAVSLNLSALTTNTAGLDHLLHYVRTCPNLSDVRLSGCDHRLSATALNTVVRNFLQAIQENTDIERLALHSIVLEADSLARLLGSSCVLSHVSIVSCYLSKNDDYPTSIRELCQAIRSNTSIESLRLISLEEDRLLVPILEQVQFQTTLRALDVTYGSTNAAEAVANVIASPQTPFLQQLTLRDSPLLHLESIVRAIRRKPSLRRLDVVQCDLDDLSAQLLRTLFRSPGQHQITTLRLCELDVEDDENLPVVFRGVAQSPTVRRVLVDRMALTSRDHVALRDCVEATVEVDQHIMLADSMELSGTATTTTTTTTATDRIVANGIIKPNMMSSRRLLLSRRASKTL